MYGCLLVLEVAVGDEVKRWGLAVLETMKMQHEITAELSGGGVNVAVTAGDQLAAEDLILKIESAA